MAVGAFFILCPCNNYSFHLWLGNAELQQKAGFSANIITRLKRNGYISLESIESICRLLYGGIRIKNGRKTNVEKIFRI